MALIVERIESVCKSLTIAMTSQTLIFSVSFRVLMSFEILARGVLHFIVSPEVYSFVLPKLPLIGKSPIVDAFSEVSIKY